MNFWKLIIDKEYTHQEILLTANVNKQVNVLTEVIINTIDAVTHLFTKTAKHRLPPRINDDTIRVTTERNNTHSALKIYRLDMAFQEDYKQGTISETSYSLLTRPFSTLVTRRICCSRCLRQQTTIHIMLVVKVPLWITCQAWKINKKRDITSTLSSYGMSVMRKWSGWTSRCNTHGECVQVYDKVCWLYMAFSFWPRLVACCMK